MQTLYMIIGTDKLYLFEQDDGAYSRLYFEGNPFLEYSLNSARQSTEQMLQLLKDQFNLESTAELEFILISNRDSLRTKAVEQEIAPHIRERLSIDEIMLDLLKKLSRDETLMVEEYGVNFDGANFRLHNGALEIEEFSLLGCTMAEDMLLGFLER